MRWCVYDKLDGAVESDAEITIACKNGDGHRIFWWTDIVSEYKLSFERAMMDD